MENRIKNLIQKHQKKREFYQLRKKLLKKIGDFNSTSTNGHANDVIELIQSIEDVSANNNLAYSLCF